MGVRSRQISGFKASLVYIEISRIARATQKDTASKRKEKKKERKKERKKKPH